MGAAAGSIRPPSPGAPVVILAGADGWRGLAVDEVIGVEEVLVRPLRATIDGLDEATGEALVASGEPAPVIDPDRLGGRGRRGDRTRSGADHTCWSMAFWKTSRDCNPMICSTTWPPLNRITVGML